MQKKGEAAGGRPGAGENEGAPPLALATTEVGLGVGSGGHSLVSDEGADEALEVGAQVGRYRVLGRVGSGGMGVVYAAFDPELERKIALKLLRPGLGGGGEAQGEFEGRLRREAQAMAKLAHPNVAAVHDVGHFGGRVFVAMEFIEGPTLGRWLGQQKRPARQILEAFSAAGRGLSAAHEAGLVHRDFKPDNVLVGDDGRVRVVDFGLARPITTDAAAGDGDAPAGPGSARAPGVTAAGSVLGTPAYIAPEQYRGREADAKSDQYAFCVSLYEALYGERPFAGGTLAELRASVEAGHVRPPPRGARVPWRLRQALLRGLSRSPDERFASMNALLAELGREPFRHARAAAGAALVLAAAGALWAWPRGEPPCRGAERHLAGVWDGARREAIVAALQGTKMSYAEAAAREVSRVLDGYAARWVEQHTEACEATRVRGGQTEKLMGLRMACLSDRRLELKAFTDRLLEADRALTERAAQAAHRLSELEGCANARALESPIPPPPNAATRTEVETLRGRLAELRGLRLAGQYKESLDAVRSLAERAEALGYRPLEAETLFLMGELADRVGDYDTAERGFERAAHAAEAGRHDELVVRALNELAFVRCVRQGHGDEIEPLSRRVSAGLERLGNPNELEAQWQFVLGSTDSERGRYADAERELARAVSLFEQKYGPEDQRLSDPVFALGVVMMAQATQREQIEKAQAHLERALAIGRRLVGDDHPQVATALAALGQAYLQSRDYDRAEATFKQTLSVLERAFGPEAPTFAIVLHNLGLVYEWQQGRNPEAIATFRRVVSLAEKSLGDDHPSTAFRRISLARALTTGGEPAEAMAILDKALPVLRKHFEQGHQFTAMALLEQGRAQAELGKAAKARELLRQSQAVFQRALGDDNSEAGIVLQTLGDVELRLHNYGRAIAPLEQALAVQRRGLYDPKEVALTDALLARALFDSGRDRPRARALAREAYEHMKGDGRMAKERAEFERWMRKRGLP